MEQFDSRQLSTALEYVKRLASGNNPVNNTPLPDDEILNNPNIIRCMFFVRDVLQSVLNNNGVVGGKGGKVRETITQQLMEELLSEFVYKQDQGIDKFLDQLYKPAGKNVRKVSGREIQSQLLANEYLTLEYNDEVKKEIKVPTEKGRAIGMRVERIVYSSPISSVYYQVVYNQQAQNFLIANWLRLLNGEKIE